MESKKGYHLDGDMIIMNRELTKLDLFVRDFLEILKKHSDYLIVSGFVSIATGRTRGTEDVDILFPLAEKSRFALLFEDLTKNGFWCYQSDDSNEAYSYINELNSIRFAKTNEMFPNIELIPFDKRKKLKFFEFNCPQRIRVKKFAFKIPPIEFEILYKELILAGKKDIEDAKHLRTFFSGMLKEDKFREYEKIIREDLK